MSNDSMAFVDKSKKDIWQTPKWLLEPLQDTIGIDLDPCAGPNTTIGETNLNIENGDNGLNQEWFGNVFINPPFSQKNEFIDKAIREKDNTDIVVLLTPDSTDVKSWYHNKITEHFKWTWFSKGRVNFYDPVENEVKKGVSFGTALHFMGGMPDALELWLRDNGDLVSRKLE